MRLNTKCYYVADPNEVFNNICHFKNLCVNVSFIKLNWDFFVEFWFGKLVVTTTSYLAEETGWESRKLTIKVENNGAVVLYVGSYVTVSNRLFFVHKLWLNKLMQCFYRSVSSKWWECYWTLIECCARSGQEKLTKTYNKSLTGFITISL